VARRIDPELVVLDWMLPGIDGTRVLSELRRFPDAYVIMLTARSEEVDKIVGLSAGADDYLTKQFSPGEWFYHCHNAYHMETGVARVVSYVD
jgi:DNA-binding response OmpR family regulator